MMQPVEQFMATMAAHIKAHSNPGVDKSSIHFTRPESPREDRNPRIWKRGRQKVSRLCVAGAPSSGAANSATTPDRAASAAHGAVSGTPSGVRALCCRLPGVWPFRPNPGLISIHPYSG
jgi:hypothetical protein